MTAPPASCQEGQSGLSLHDDMEETKWKKWEETQMASFF